MMLCDFEAYNNGDNYVKKFIKTLITQTLPKQMLMLKES